MLLHKLFTLSVALASAALARQAVADVAPPAGYVEQCTIAKKQRSGSECVECRTMREMYANSDRCVLLLSPYCFQKVCEVWGGASYLEVWCRTMDADTPTVPDAIVSQLPKYGAADLSSAPAPTGVTCAPYTPPAESQDGGGCSIEPGWKARGFAWLLACAAGVGFIFVRRRFRR
jgi:hypothetical protein